MLTNPSRNDGFGAQYQTIIYAAITAELKNMKFLYTRFKQMEHNYDNDPDYIIKKENLINFLDFFDECKDNLQERQAIHPTLLIAYIEGNIEAASNTKVLSKIKDAFHKGKTKRFEKYVAIHVRMPNPHDNRGVEHADHHYIKIIKDLRSLYPDYEFHIHSQKGIKIEDYPDYCVMHIDESCEDAFTDLALADVLVTCASSFSYVAGLVSRGKVYYMKFWHKPLPNWTIL